MKKYIREIIILLLIVIIYFSVNTCQKNKSDVELLKNSKDSVLNTIKYFKNKNNDLVSQVKTKELTIDQLKEYGDNLGINNEKLKRQVGSLNNLMSQFKGVATVRDSFTTINYDTIIKIKDKEEVAKFFNWDNKFLKINGIITPERTSLVYDYKFDFAITSYRKRDWFFKRKELVADVVFSDPNLKVKEFKSISIKEPKKKFYETRGFAAFIGFIGSFFILR